MKKQKKLNFLLLNIDNFFSRKDCEYMKKYIIFAPKLLNNIFLNHERNEKKSNSIY